MKSLVLNQARMEETIFKISFEKCRLFKNSIHFLGPFIVEDHYSTSIQLNLTPFLVVNPLRRQSALI